MVLGQGMGVFLGARMALEACWGVCTRYDKSEATGVVGSWLQLILFIFHRSYLIPNYAYTVYVGMVTVCPVRSKYFIEAPQGPTESMPFGPTSQDPRRRGMVNLYYQIRLCCWL